MSKAKRWQIILSSIVFIAAALIMLPQLLSFAAGIGRLAILAIIIISAAAAVSFLQVKYLRRTGNALRSDSQEIKQPDKETKNNP